MYACVSVLGKEHENAGKCKGQKKVVGPLELELQEDMSFLLQALENKLQSSKNAESALNSLVTFPASPLLEGMLGNNWALDVTRDPA